MSAKKSPEFVRMVEIVSILSVDMFVGVPAAGLA